MVTARRSHSLREVRLFSGLSTSDLDAISRAARPATAHRGDVLCRQGEPGHEFFLIVGGEATVHRSGKKIRRLGPGDSFGELALLDRGVRSATVTADGDMSLMVVSELDFSALLDEVPALAHKLLATLAARLRVAESGAVE